MASDEALEVGRPAPVAVFYEGGGREVPLADLHRDGPLVLYALRAFT